MRMQPPGATKTSRTASCWPWSTSPSWIRSTTAPVLSQCMPTCSRIDGSSQLTNLGDTTPALERNDSSTMLWTTSGSRAQSSWQSRKNAAPSTMPRASLLAAAYPGRPGRRRTKASGRIRPTRTVGSRPVAGDQDQDRELLVVLGRQGGQRLLQPGTRPGGHHDRHDRRYLGVHQVLEANRSRSANADLSSRSNCLQLFNKSDTLVGERTKPQGPNEPLGRASDGVTRSGTTEKSGGNMPEVTNISAISKGVTDLARDAAYVAVGLGVLGFQRAQVQRVELQERSPRTSPWTSTSAACAPS